MKKKDNLSQLSWNKSDDAILTEVNHNQMSEGNKMKNMNALPQMNLKEKPLDSLSALPETHEVASIVSKMKKKIAWLSAEI